MIQSFLTSAALIALTAGAATGQSEQPSPSRERSTDDVITVYGEGLNRTVQETPTSVAVIGDLTLEDGNFDDYFDALRRVANVSSNNGELNFNIRGINNNTNQTGGASTAGQPVSGVYIDGLIVPADAFSLNLFAGAQSTWDVQQLEIYRGVQITRGRQTPVGSVFIQTKNPTDEFEAEARIIAGNYNTYSGAFAISGPISEELGLTGRLSLEAGHTDGAIENTTRNVDDPDYRDILNVRGKLRWQPAFAPDFNATISLASYNFDTGLDSVPLEIFLMEDHGDRRQSIVDTIEDREYRMTTAQLNANYRVNEHVDLSFMAGYTDASEDTYAEVDYSNEPTYGRTYREFPDEQIFATELRGRFDFERFYGAAGLYYDHMDSTYNLHFFGVVNDPYNNPFPVNQGSISSRNKDITIAAAYGDIFFPLMDEFITVGGGLRVERFENETAIGRAAGDTNSTFEQTLVSPKASVMFNWSDNFSTTFAAARGTRPGYQSSYLNQSTGEIEVFDADEEQLWNYEVAFRYQNDRLTANTNVFFIDWTNQIGSVEGPTGEDVPANLGSSEAYGLEIEASYDVTDNIDAFLTFGYLHTEFTADARGVDGAGSIVGNEFGKAPSFSGSFGATYRNDRGFFATGSVTFEDESFDGGGNSTTVSIENPRTLECGVTEYPATIDARTVVDTKIGYEADNYAVYFYVDNLLDEDYIDNISFRNSSRTAPFTPPFSGSYPYDATFVQPGDPRTFGVELRVQY